MTHEHSPSPSSAAADVLRAARAKIEQPGAWVKGRLAVDRRTGGSVNPKHPRATCWCAEGAIIAAAPSTTEYLSALAALEAIVWPARVPLWNDSAFRTHDEVLEGFDKAITVAEAREAML